MFYSHSKSSRKRKTREPCSVCGLGPTLCLCSLLPQLDLRTGVTLVVHEKELRRTTNTGRLVVHSLVNSEMRVRGRKGSPLSFKDLVSSSLNLLLLFPAEDAMDLMVTPLDQLRRRPGANPADPFHLIIPDGNWRQASKVHSRYPELREVPRVQVQIPRKSESVLRKETSEYGIATLQAVAHALGVFEGDSVKEALLTVYEEKLRRTLLGRPP